MDLGTPLTGMLKCLSHCHPSVRYEAVTPLDLFKVFLTLIFKAVGTSVSVLFQCM